MNLSEIFLNPQTGLLRSGWRVTVFLALCFLPYILYGLILTLFRNGSGEASTTEAGVGVNAGTFFTYVLLNGWMLAVSWFCLRLMENRRLGALGFSFERGWWREIWLGCAMAALMIVLVVLMQMIGGGTRVTFNAMFWKTVDGMRVMDWQGWMIVGRRVIAALALFMLTGLFEELLFRGFAFQTLLRDVPAWVPILLLSALFGLVHTGNPDATFFSTINTILAGVWLSVAYLKTCRLWFPTALHFVWNWVMGAIFGLPVSGLKIIPSPILFSTSEAPHWLTGGSYGPEGGVAATVVLVIATVIVWQATWLHRLQPQSAAPDSDKIKLNLRQPETH
jgi:hypothetical protein